MSACLHHPYHKPAAKLKIHKTFVSIFVTIRISKIEHNEGMRKVYFLLILTALIVGAIRPISAARDENVPVFETATIDNDSPGYVKNGVADWHSEPIGYRNRTDWTYSNRNPVANPNTVYWLPSLAGSGLYEIEVFIPDGFATTTNARYFVLHQGRRTLRVINQLVNNGRWVPIGTFYMEDTSRDGVYLDDVTYENVISMVAFDAIRFIPANRAQPAPVVPTLPAPTANVSLLPNSGRIGSIVTVFGSDFIPDEQVQLLFGVAPDDAFMRSAMMRAKSDGTVVMEAGIPNIGNPLYVILKSPSKTVSRQFIVLP